MAKIIETKKSVKGKKFAIVVSRFNEFVTKRLLAGCLDELALKGVKKKDITVVWVPGSFEIPVTAMKLAKKKNIHAVISIGVIIRGETVHFDLIAQATARGIMQVSLEAGKPVIFCILSTETIDQAYKRSQGKGGDNRGRDAADAAIEMAGVLSKIK